MIWSGSLPYYSGTTKLLSQIMHQARISAQNRAQGTLRENLVKSKDKLKANPELSTTRLAPVPKTRPAETRLPT